MVAFAPVLYLFLSLAFQASCFKVASAKRFRQHKDLQSFTRRSQLAMATEKNAVDIKTSVEVPVEAKQFASCMGTAHAITGAWGFVGRSQKFGKVEIETFNIMTTRMFRDIDQGK
ncbi:unnamed protein product [Heterosigma akashiwo]